MRWVEEQLLKLEEVEKDKIKLKRYRVKQLKKMIHLVDGYSSEGCEACDQYQDSIDRMIEFLEDEKQFDEYLCLYNLVLDHLSQKHQYYRAWIQCIAIVLLCGILGFFFSYFIHIHHLVGGGSGILVGLTLGMAKEYQLNKSGKRI